MIAFNFDLVSVGATIAGIGILGFTIFFSDRKSITSRTFIAFSFFTILWSVANYLQYQTSQPEIGLWIVRVITFVGCWHAFMFFQLCYVFPERSFLFPKLYARVLIPLVGLTSVLTLTPLVFERVDKSTAQGVVAAIQNGPGISIFGLVVLSLIVSGVGVLVRKIFVRQGQERKQIMLMGLGMVVTFSCIVFFNIILPAVYNNANFLPFSAAFVFPFIACTALAIYRYKLLNIKVLTTEIVAFLLSISTLFQVVFAATPAEYLFRISIFVLVLIFSILVVKNVMQEVHQREVIEVQERKLEDTNARLQEMDKQKNEFLSYASHQLRTPLTAIKWSAGGILDGMFGGLPIELKDPIQTIFDESSMMALFINDYLNVSRIEQGRMEYRFVPTNMVDLLRTTALQLEPGLRQKGLTLTLNIGVGTVMVWADASKLTQVISNLIDNAMKYTPSGGITITLKNIPMEKKVRIEIKDTGIGMDSDTRDKVFEKFVRGENAKVVNGAGSGLGLFIVKTFVAAHKGSIRIESDGLGKGSSFVLEFPLLVQSSVSVQPPVVHRA